MEIMNGGKGHHVEGEQPGETHPGHPGNAWLASGSSVETIHTQKKCQDFQILLKLPDITCFMHQFLFLLS